MSTNDNVIRPVFGAKPREVPQEPQPVPERVVHEGYKHVGTLEGDALRRAQIDLVYLLRHHDYANHMRDRLQQLGDIVFDLTNYVPDPRSIELRRQGLRTLSLEQICELAENLNELQVRMQPSYLGALVLEHAARLNAALSLMNEPGED